MTIDLTGRQINVMSHALGYPKMYRNRFFAAVGTPNDDTWKQLVKLNLAEGQPDGSMICYCVTEAGVQALQDFYRRNA